MILWPSFGRLVVVVVTMVVMMVDIQVVCCRLGLCAVGRMMNR